MHAVHNAEINTLPIHRTPDRLPQDPPLHGQPPRTIEDITNWRSIIAYTDILTPAEIYAYLFRAKKIQIQYSLRVVETPPPAPNADHWIHRDTLITHDLTLPAGVYTLEGDPATWPTDGLINAEPFNPGDGFTSGTIQQLSKTPTENYTTGSALNYTGNHMTASDLDAAGNYHEDFFEETAPALTESEFHHAHFRYYCVHDQGFREEYPFTEYHRITADDLHNHRLAFEIELGIANGYTQGFVGLIPQKLLGRTLIIPDQNETIVEPELSKFEFTANIFGHDIPMAIIHELTPEAGNSLETATAELLINVTEWHDLP